MRRGSLVLVGCLFAVFAFAASAQAATFPLTISTASSSNITSVSGGGTVTITPNGSGAVLNVSELESHFGSSPIVIDVGSAATTSTITIANDISTTSLGELDFSAASGIAIDTAKVSTEELQDYNAPVTLGADTTLSTVQSINFDSTLDGAHSLTISGLGTFNGAVGSTTALTSVDISGATDAAGGPITTTGDQTYTGPVHVNSDTTLSSTGSGNIACDSTVDGGHALTVTTNGLTSFSGAVGGTTALTGLTVDGPLNLNGGSVGTSGAGGQGYFGPVTLGADTTLTAGNSATIGFRSRLDGDFGLTVDTSGLSGFDLVGATSPLASITTDAGGSTLLNATVSTVGDQSFGDDVVAMTASPTDTSTNGSITFHATLREGSSGHDLLISAPTMITFDGTVGASGGSPGKLTVNGPATIGADVTSLLAQEYTGPVTIAGSATLTSTGRGVAFDSTIEGASDLTVSASGTVWLGGAVGATTPLTSFTLSSGSLDVNGAGIATSGDESFGAHPVTIDSAATLTSPLVTSTGTVTLNHDLTVDGGGSLTGTISGAGKLTKTGTGTLTLGGSNSYAGGTSVTGGLLEFPTTGSFGTGNVTVDGGGLQWAPGTTDDVSSQLNAIGAGGATFDTNGNDVSFAQALTGSGPIVKSGAGELTLTADNSESGAVDVTGGTLAVPGGGTVSGHVTVESNGTLTCTGGGTLAGGVTNDGGTATAVPDAPTNVTATAGDGQATVSFTPGASNCLPAGAYTVTASPGGAHASGSGSPITVTGLTDHESYTFTVIATNPIGSSAASTASNGVSPESGPPKATVSSPQDGTAVNIGQRVSTAFACTEARGGPGIDTCVDSNGATGGTGRLDTSKTGTFPYTVTATSKDGQHRSTTVHYTVRGKPTVTIVSPAAAVTYTVGDVARANYGCLEGTFGPGIRSCKGTVTSGAKINTSTPGRHAFAVTATSTDGLKTTRTVSYRVVRPNNRFTVFHIVTRANGDVSFKVRVPGPGVVNSLLTAWIGNAVHVATVLPPAPHRFVYARAHTVATQKGVVTVTVHPNGRGRRLVSHHTFRVTLRLWVTYRPPHGIQRKQGFRALHLGEVVSHPTAIPVP